MTWVVGFKNSIQEFATKEEAYDKRTAMLRLWGPNRNVAIYEIKEASLDDEPVLFPEPEGDNDTA